jgi:hypothetical protein
LNSVYLTAKQLRRLNQQSSEGLRSLGQSYAKSILIDDHNIFIWTTAFAKALDVDTKELLMDAIFSCYRDQDIHVMSNQENFDHTGLTEFLLEIVRRLGIPPQRVKISTTNANYSGPFSHTYKDSSTFVAAGQYLPAAANPCDTSAKFIGTAIGRFSVSRLRLTYAMDLTFPGDTVIVFQDLQTGLEQLNRTGAVYDREIAWARGRQFDQDLSPEDYAREYWIAGCRSYYTWSAGFQIDVVAESNVFDCNFVTEKIAKPLATGKPFVLLGARHSLAALRERGFVTFGDFIDESYDEESVPYLRIRKMMKSLQKLYHSPQRQHILGDMVAQAQYNIGHYTHLCRGL